MKKEALISVVLLLFLLVSCVPKEPISGEAAKPAVEEINKIVEEASEPVPEAEVSSAPESDREVPKPTSILVNGKTVEERIQEAYDTIHTPGSAQYIRENFPDIVLVYTDPGEPFMPQEILPFRYYYSKEADKTFNICNVELTVFICDGKLERLVTDEDINSNRCIVTPVYQLAEKYSQ